MGKTPSSHQDEPVKVFDGQPTLLREGIVTHTGFFRQLGVMLRAFWAVPQRNTILFLGSSILLFIIIITYGQVAINHWYENFYDAIEAVDLDAFIIQLLVFLGIVSILLIFNIGQTYLNQSFKLKLREGLAMDLMKQWMSGRRAFRLGLAGEIGVNPDQRLHEDARHLAESTADLGINLVQSTVILVSFLAILWGVSAGFIFNIGGYSFAIPGYMVWAVLLYAAIASVLTWVVGRRLVPENATRYAREGELRGALMRVNEHVDAVVLAGGQQAELQRLDRILGRVVAAIRRIVFTTTRLTAITAGYGWITNVAPFVIAAPLYFNGSITFGQLFAAVNAFNQAHNSLRWFVDNYGALADWRATMLRVATFRQALVQLDQVDQPAEGRIKIDQAEQAQMTFENVEIFTDSGRIIADRESATIAPGSHALVWVDDKSDHTIIFRALSGLWPWGQGTITMPKSAHITWLPHQPYIPVGTLRDALIYPALQSDIIDEDLKALLVESGLEAYAESLDHVARWDRVLSAPEQYKLALAQLVLAQPDWIISDVDFNRFSTNDTQNIRTMLERYIPSATLVIIGDMRKSDRAFFDQVLKMHFVANKDSQTESEKQTGTD